MSTKIFPSYKQSRPDATADVVLIGSGIGALTCGSLLAKQGRKVLILEKHYTIGGFTHTFKRREAEWDVGLHYVGEFHRPHSFLRKISDYISDQGLAWADMGTVYDQIVLGKKVYPFFAGEKAFVAGLSEQFPNEQDQAAIRKYVAAIKEVAGSAKDFYVHKALPDILQTLTYPWMGKSYRQWSRRTTQEVLGEFTKNRELQAVLAGQYGDYGLPPGQSSFAIHAMVARHYLNGGCYPVGGSGMIAKKIGEVLQKYGGNIYSNAEVQEVMVEGNQAVGVRMADGFEIRCNTVISSAGLYVTVEKLMHHRPDFKSYYQPILDAIKPSASHLSLYISVSGDAHSLGLPKANFWIYPEKPGHDEHVARFLEDPSQEIPVIYISFPSAKDPSWNDRYPGISTIEVITLADHRWFEPWENTDWKKRGDDYEKLKDHWKARLMEYVHQWLPQVKGKVVTAELSTPLSTRHFTGHKHGAIYGIDHSPERFRMKRLKPATPIRGLYLTGQDVVTVGIGGAMMGGFLTANVVLGKDLTKVIIPKN